LLVLMLRFADFEELVAEPGMTLYSRNNCSRLSKDKGKMECYYG